MDNNKMTRVAKNLDIFANVGGKITGGAGIACILIAFLTLVFGGKMFAEGNVTLNLDFIKFHFIRSSLSFSIATDKAWYFARSSSSNTLKPALISESSEITSQRFSDSPESPVSHFVSF